MASEAEVRPYDEADLSAMRRIWNAVVADGMAFPQEEELSEEGARSFFAAQSACGVAVCDGEVRGLYILHPNNVGRCAHVANASYAVDAAARGRHIGRALVTDSLERAGDLGFRGLQFNAVVDSNAGARHLYESLGFVHVGTIPQGFRMKDGRYENTHIYYHPCG